MSPEYVNSISAETDISGSPPAVQTPQQLSADQRKKQNQNERRPGKGAQQPNPLQQAASAVGGAAQHVQQAEQGAEQWLGSQGLHGNASPNPLDWPQEDLGNAEAVWGLARNAYKTLSGDYHDGVAGLYAGNSAQDKFGQQLGEQLPMFEGVLGMASRLYQDTGQQEPGLLQGAQELAGVPVPQQGQSEQQYGEQALQQAPGLATNVGMAAVAPENLAGRAGLAALPIMQSLLAQDPNESGAAWTWLAIAGGLLSVGHVPPSMRKFLLSRFADWPLLEKAVQQAGDLKQKVARSFQDPGKRPQQTTDAIEAQLARGGLPSGSKLVTRAAKPGEAQRVAAEITPEGAIKVLPSESRAALKKLLNRIGVEDVDELVHKATMEGISDPKLVKGIIQHWKDLGLPYDLNRYHPAEAPLRDPRRHLDALADQQVGVAHVAALNHYLDEIHRGLFANHSNPMSAVLRALAGHSRALNLTHQQWMTSVLRVLGKDGVNPEAGQRLMQAAEGDQDAYQSLRPEEQMIVDGWGLLRSAAREESQGTDYAKNFVPNWVPRTDRDPEEMLRGRGRPSRASVLSREARLHREESLQAGPSGQLVLGQRFKAVAEANQALASARAQLVANLINPEYKLTAELANDPEARAIHELAGTDPAGAMERARRLAVQKYADKESSFLLNVNRYFANQVRAISTHRALREFTGEPERPGSGMVASDGRAAAIKLRLGAERQREEFLRQGYRHLDDGRFAGFVFHPELADNLNRYVNHVSRGLRDAPGWKQALALEGKIVAGIMFAPPIHGLNVAGRWGMAALSHPLQMTNYLLKGKALLPHQHDEASWALRSEAYNAGMVPHYRSKNYADNLLSSLQDALSDTEEQLPASTRGDSRQNRLRTLWDSVARPQRAVNNYFWGMVNDFGTMMYHLEKTAASHAGMEDAAAQEYAARRANSWMGAVAPEDTNPMLHDLSRLVLFAPNWWRTWGELMVPLYKRAGFTSDPAYAKFAAMQSLKTVTAAIAMQKLTGNALNYFLSGHLQNGNQPGSQDRLEITNPAILHAMQAAHALPQGMDPNTGTDSRTGARMTMENPLARQQLSSETALGLASGHADYQPSDTWDGVTKFVGARLSPLLDAGAGALNFDLYQSLADHQLRSVDPTEPGLRLSPASLLFGAIMMTPMGMNFSNQVSRGAAEGDANPVESALGTQVPLTLQEAVKDIGDPAGRTLFSWFTGTNPPYASAQRSRGIKPSDQDYQRALELTNTYRQQMRVLSTQMLGGQMTPYQWRQKYVDLSRAHAAQMAALYKDSPEYVNGGQGLASQWEQLYEKATDPNTGQLNQDQLSVLQAQMLQELTPEQQQQMSLVLRQNDSRYPALALYHRSLQQFSEWQQQWATQHNVDIRQLHHELSEYGSLYGDTQAQRAYLRQHRDVNAYETAKRNQFDRTLPGLTHAMFYGNNSTLARYLRARHLTMSQFASEQEATAA